MNEQERAEEHLRTIRRLMERATIYRAISAPTALAGGLLSLLASAIAFRSDGPGFGSPGCFQIAFILIWLLVFLLTAAANTLFIVLGARKRQEPVFSASMKAALAALAPALLTGAAFTFAYATEDTGSALGLITVFWSTFYGLSLLATSHFAPRSLIVLGWAFLITGIAALVFLSISGAEFPGVKGAQCASLFMAATFGLYHLIYAACAWARNDAEACADA